MIYYLLCIQLDRKSSSPKIKAYISTVHDLLSQLQFVYDCTAEKLSMKYDKLCICSGAQPKTIASHPNVIGIRDLQSVTDMTKRLSLARKIVVVGNGGIALELIHSVSTPSSLPSFLLPSFLLMMLFSHFIIKSLSIYSISASPYYFKVS